MAVDHPSRGGGEPHVKEERLTGVMRLLPARKGHFLLESGHHGDLWLDMELLMARPAVVRELAKSLAIRVATYAPDVVCGPLVEGAFVALMVAEELGLPLSYSVPSREQGPVGLFPVRYDIPSAQRSLVEAKRVAVVNDVINAGAAVRGTFEAIRSLGGTPTLLASLAVLGTAAQRFADEQRVALETLEVVPNTIWPPAECPMCAADQPPPSS
jgi:orotate phosphoribosyltransferase